MIALFCAAFAAEPDPVAPGSEPVSTEPVPSEPVPSEPVSTEPVPSEPVAEPAPAPVVGGVVDRVAVIVNDDIITLSDIYDIGRDYISEKCPTREDACVTTAEIEIADALIKRALIGQELERLDLTVDAVQVDQSIDQLVRQYQMADRQALRDEIERSGKRWEDYRTELQEYLRVQAFQSRVLAPRVSVTQDELRDAYQRVARKVKTPTAKASAIGLGIPADGSPELVSARLRDAFEIVRALNAGELTWEDAVTKYDDGMAPIFAGQEFTESSLVEAFRAPVFTGELGKAQPPVSFTLPTGTEVLVILRPDSRGDRSDTLPLEQVEPQLREQVFKEKLEAAEEEWYQRARRLAAVDVKLGQS